MLKKLKKLWLRLGVAMSLAVGAILPNVQVAMAANEAGGGVDTAVHPNGFNFSAGTNGTITITPGTQVSIGGTDWRTGLAEIVVKYKGIAQVILGLCTITALVLFILSIARLSTSAVDSMPMARKKAATSILISGIALALFGSLTTVVGFFWNFI